MRIQISKRSKSERHNPVNHNLRNGKGFPVETGKHHLHVKDNQRF
jgi:hypothetical protein